MEDRDSVLKRAFILPRKLTLAVHSHRWGSPQMLHGTLAARPSCSCCPMVATGLLHRQPALGLGPLAAARRRRPLGGRQGEGGAAGRLLRPTKLLRHWLCRMSSEEQIAQVLQENATMRQQLLICQARVREQNMQLRIRDGNIEDLQSRLQQVQRHYDDLRQHDDYLAQKKRKRDDDAAAAATKEVQELVNRVQDVEQQLAACRADLAQRRLSGAGSAEPRQQQQQQAGGGGAQPPGECRGFPLVGVSYIETWRRVSCFFVEFLITLQACPYVQLPLRSQLPRVAAAMRRGRA